MTEQKHTPGPWHIDWNGGMAPRILGLHAPGITREIADVRFHDGSNDPQVHANARLIAAAPELLAALVALRDACEVRANREGGDYGPEIGPAVELAATAIAKTMP